MSKRKYCLAEYDVVFKGHFYATLPYFYNLHFDVHQCDFLVQAAALTTDRLEKRCIPVDNVGIVSRVCAECRTM